MDDDTVYKVVPVGGDVVINESEQTSYDNALQEILVSKMLSGKGIENDGSYNLNVNYPSYILYL